VNLQQSNRADVDVVLVGAGVMSATFATLLKELEPSLRIAMYESLEAPAEESSNAWNNAGTGHAAMCELNYTSDKSDGTVDISRALKVNTEFDLSRQFWSYLVRSGAIPDPSAFIHSVAHVSFVHGAANVAFLKRRYTAMSAHHCFTGMEYSEDPAVLATWMPLVMEGRDPSEPVAGTRMLTGTDCDFGALTRMLVANLQKQPGFTASFRRRVTDLRRDADGYWSLRLPRCGRRRVAVAAKIEHPRGQRLRRFPGERAVATLRRSGACRTARCEGVRQSVDRCAADVGAASRFTHRQR
jgi:malate dehydrogenase (quinone)